MAESFAKRVDREARRDRVMALALTGASIRQIAPVVNVHPATVARDIQARLKESAENCPNTKQYRELMRMRINALIIQHWDRAQRSLDALDRVTRLLEMESRLYGLSMPRKIELSGELDVGLKKPAWMKDISNEDLAELRAEADRLRTLRLGEGEQVLEVNGKMLPVANKGRKRNERKKEG